MDLHAVVKLQRHLAGYDELVVDAGRRVHSRRGRFHMSSHARKCRLHFLERRRDVQVGRKHRGLGSNREEPESKPTDGWKVHRRGRRRTVVGERRQRVCTPQPVELRTRNELERRRSDALVTCDYRLSLGVVTGDNSTYVHGGNVHAGTRKNQRRRHGRNDAGSFDVWGNRQAVQVVDAVLGSAPFSESVAPMVCDVVAVRFPHGGGGATIPPPPPPTDNPMPSPPGLPSAWPWLPGPVLVWLYRSCCSP